MTLAPGGAVGEHLAFGDFELAPAARVLWRSGTPVKLCSRALDILIALASRPGELPVSWRMNTKRMADIISACRR
jgi:hypothetical protein